jgi:hypothetical protein
MGLFNKKKAPPPPLPEAPKPAPMPTEQDADKVRAATAKRVAGMQGMKSTILSGVLGDSKPKALVPTVMGRK